MNGAMWKLIEDVRAVGPTAAGKLYRMARKGIAKVEQVDHTVLHSFIWSCTPEGHQYWANLNRKVNDRRKSPIYSMYHPGD